MKLSTKSRYGTRMLLDMALHAGNGPIGLGVIARRQGVPVKYLEQIMIPLKKAGYVNSVRGYKGGYSLARTPETITVGEIVALLEGGLELTSCCDFPSTCGRAETCAVRALWQEAAEAMHKKLDTVTIADLVAKTRATASMDGQSDNEDER